MHDTGDERHSRNTRLPRPPASWVLARLVWVPAVFTFYLWVWLADRVGLVRLIQRLRGAPYELVDAPAALRLAFERLGPTYIKLGQLVASGEALFPPRYSDEFQKCLDRVPPFSFEAVRAILNDELSADALAQITELSEVPIAAASIAQVHTARLADGAEVVVKVQRPGLAKLVSADVFIMRFFAKVMSALSRALRAANVVAVVEDFETNLVAELDFRNEADRMRDFRAVMDSFGTDSVSAPFVYDELSRARVLTMERFRGWSLADTAAIKETSYDAEERLLTGIRAWFQTLIAKGFFHGDVHAGNFMLLEDGRVGYLDFGIVGTFDDEQRKNVLLYVTAMQSRDFGQLAEAMVAMGAAGNQVDRARLAVDLEQAFAPMIDPDDGFRMADLVPALLRVSRTHQLRMPRDLVLVTKQLVYLDRYSRAIGGPKMNVLTDQRLKNLILQDSFALAFA